MNYVYTIVETYGKSKVHAYERSFLPEEKNLTPIGYIETCQDAEREAKRYYPDTTNGCF
jgi:hypothetical protein